MRSQVQRMTQRLRDYDIISFTNKSYTSIPDAFKCCTVSSRSHQAKKQMETGAQKFKCMCDSRLFLYILLFECNV